MTPRNQDPRNLQILADRMAALDRQPGPRVGDFLTFQVPDERCRNYTRFTHDWGDQLQTGGSEHGAYYHFGSNMSYSGGLDPGVDTADLIATPKKRDGSLWFFDLNMAGAGRGVDFYAPFRVFTLRPGAKTEGIGELRCPYHLSVLDEACHRRTCGYWYVVTKHTMSCTAFAEEAQLRAWLLTERVILTRPLTPPGTISHQSLGWPAS